MSLLSSSQRTAVLAPPLPINNKVFNSLRLYLRLGQFTILGAAPSVGKSIFARNLVAKTVAPSLFFSADSDEYTVKTSVAACLTREPLELVEKQMNDESWSSYYDDIFSRTDHVEWSFKDIDIDYVEARLDAYSEPYG